MIQDLNFNLYCKMRRILPIGNKIPQQWWNKAFFFFYFVLLFVFCLVFFSSKHRLKYKQSGHVFFKGRLNNLELKNKKITFSQSRIYLVPSFLQFEFFKSSLLKWCRCMKLNHQEYNSEALILKMSRRIIKESNQLECK